MLSVTGALNWTVRQFGETEVQMNAVERVDYYASLLTQEAPPIIEGNRPPADWPSQGRIIIKNLVFQYQPHLPPVLNGISLDIKPGEKIGIVGRTGSGKSTIMNALFRIVEPTSGDIEIDGVDILKIGLKDLRSKLAIIRTCLSFYYSAHRY